jgi:hypothetical protein
MSSVRQDFRTSDLYFAAYLKAIGLEFKDHVRLDGEVYFIFEFRDDIQDLRKSFFNRQGKVSALDYADELRALKSLCHNRM